MPEKPKDEFIVSAAGPLVNIIIAGILWVYLSLISPADLTQILIVIGFFIFLGAKGEYEMMKYRDILNNYKVKDIVKTDYEELDDNESLGAATEKLVHMSNRGFVIKSGGEYSGILTKNDLIKGLNVYGKEGKVKEVVNENIEKVNPGMTLFRY